MKSLIRGACPRLSQPMPTGDGLLARLTLPGPLSIDTLIALCEASERHGNGILEVTNRASLQIRGLTPESAPAFHAAVAALGLDEHPGPPVLTSSLLGLTAGERPDLLSLSAELRARLSDPALASISPKVSVLLDEGCALHLDDMAGDVRLRAAPGPRWHLSIGGTAAGAFPLGWLEPQYASEAIFRVLIAIARRGPTARGRDLATGEESRELLASLQGIVSDAPAPGARPTPEPIGVHALNDERVAVGIAPAFGHTGAKELKGLARHASRLGATALETAPGRAFLAIGASAGAAAELRAEASAAGFLVQADDPRRYVIACAGAPACRAGMLSTRELAPAIADAAKQLLDGSLTIHVSGCAKGCAHPGIAALTLVGPDGLIVEGRAASAPDATLSPAELLAGIPRLQSARRRSSGALERSADAVSRLGKRGLVDVLRGASRA